MVVVKKPVTQVNKYEELLAGYAVAAAATEVVSMGNFIGTRGGLNYKGSPVPGNKMNVVVIGSVMENHFYTDRFDPDNPASPKCFAFSEDGKNMAPHELSEVKQSEACANCPQNEWGSADVGKGKACKNIRRLGLITEDGLDDVENAELAVMKLPVTSVKAWSVYVNQLAELHRRPPFAVVTEITWQQHPKWQFELTFKLVGTITDEEALTALIARKEAVINELSRPYQPTPTPEPAAPAVGGKVGNKRKY